MARLLEEELDRLRAENSRLNDKFSCGHRKVDFDDSYGECACCKMKALAFDYDRLPHTVIECHERIEELEEEHERERAHWHALVHKIEQELEELADLHEQQAEWIKLQIDRKKA